MSVWLKADVDVLMRRTKRRGDRPLVDQLKTLLPLREPYYAHSDLTVQSREEPHDAIVDELIAGLAAGSTRRWRLDRDRPAPGQRAGRG